MKTINFKKLFFILFLSLSFIFSVFFISTYAKLKNSIFTLPPDAFYNYNYKITQNGNQFLILSNDEDNSFKLSLFDSEKPETIPLFEGDSSIVAKDINGKYFCTAENQKENKLRLEQYIVEDKELIPLTSVIIKEQNMSTNTNLFAYDGENVVMADSQDTHILKIYAIQDGDVVETKSYELEHEIKSIKEDANGNIYVLTGNPKEIIQCVNREIISTIYENIEGDVNFINSNYFIDSTTTVFEHSSLEHKFKTCCGNNIAYIEDNAIITPVIRDNKTVLLKIDIDTHEPTGEFYLDKYPDFIFGTDKSLFCFSCDNEGKMNIEIVGNTPEKINYNVIDVINSEFVAAKPIGENYTEDVNNLKEWCIYWEKEKIIAGERGFIKVIIEHNGSVYTFTSEDGKVIFEPQNSKISFSFGQKLKSGNYNISVTGFCSNTGVPIKLCYTTKLVDKVKPSSSSRSSSSSSSKPSSLPTDKKIHSDTYNIDRNSDTITGIEPGTTFSELKSNLLFEGTLLAIHKDGDNIKTGKVGTGTRIILIDSGGNQTDELTVLIYGDAIGNGNVDNASLEKIRDYVLGKINLTNLEYRALDVDHNGKVEDMDVVIINDHIKNRCKIKQ